MDALLQRHIIACNNAVLPGGRLRFAIGEHPVGWVLPDLARALEDFAGITVDDDTVTLAAGRAADLPGIARALADRGRLRWRGEAFDVRAGTDGPVLAQIDRGALPVFGILAHGVHVNGLVRSGDAVHVWVARRAADKALDPGKFDHIVAGGVAAGMTPGATLIKEAAEEAAIPAALAATATPVGTVSYAMERPEGLRRDWLHCYDLELPAAFQPIATDGEVESFELWSIADAVQAVRNTDAFKFNVNLVLIDLFRRFGLA